MPLDEEEENSMPFARLLLTMAVLSLALFVGAIDQTIVATATVRISEEFDAMTQIVWLANAYQLSSTALQPVTGKLSDIFGRTQVLLASLVIFAAGSLSMNVLLAGRGIAGAGSAGIIGLTLVIVSDIVPMRKRGPYMAIFSLVFSISSVVGPLLGGVFTDHISWRWVFWLSEPIAGFVIVAVIILIRFPHSSTGMWAKLKRIDYLGILLLVGGLTMFMIGLTLPSNGHSWGSTEVVLCMSGGAVAVALFFIVEWKFALDPIVPLRLFQIRNVTLMMGGSFFMGACMFTIIFFIPLYYNVVENLSSTQAGLYLLPFVIGILITSILTGWLVARLGIYRPFMWTGTAVCAVGIGLLMLLDRSSILAERICYLLIAGLGMGAFIQLSLIAGQAAARVEDMASATAVLTFFRSIGSVCGMAAMQTVLQTELRNRLYGLINSYSGFQRTILRAIDNPHVIYGSHVPLELRDEIIDAYMHSLNRVFLIMLVFAVAMFLWTLPLQHRTLARRLPKRTAPDEVNQRAEEPPRPSSCV
ncbi:MFS general substrate transporter [Linderina pennispora]|uniref:MFS general substrate transporter n=1 Tax=Linderina pennispora TaxID=61395 RepID=A0A1Y1WIZ6_9FUNG|nr:MFS general substrate transporter [Linderina pennispora]ORX73335.1 MFS general substrate transporter [Linderina pennispora]